MAQSLCEHEDLDLVPQNLHKEKSRARWYMFEIPEPEVETGGSLGPL